MFFLLGGRPKLLCEKEAFRNSRADMSALGSLADLGPAIHEIRFTAIAALSDRIGMSARYEKRVR